MDAVLSHDHAEIDVLLADGLEKLESGDAGAFNALDLFWARLAMHIRAEHLHLFPAVIKISKTESLPDVPEILASLRQDHDFFMHELASIIKTLRSENERETLHEAARRVNVIKDRLTEHNVVEEEKIYPLRSLLSDEDDKHLSISIAKELANFPPRFSR